MNCLHIRTLCVLAGAALALAGCSKSDVAEYSAPPSGDALMLEVHPAEEQEAQPAARDFWHGDEGVICVLFGYGYNDDGFYTDAMQKLSAEYGLAETGGLILPLKYPDDFKSRISELKSMLDEQDLRGLIILGAPENTHATLSRMREDWNGDLPYPVFSFFPQDDVLGQEATCDFVLEYERKSEEDGDSSVPPKVDANAETLLSSAILYMTQLGGALPADKSLHTHVQNIAAPHKVIRYTDRETGIQSINHFIME